MQRSGCGHDEEIAEVGMPRAVKVSMAEAHNGFIIILVACAVTIYLRIVFPLCIVRDGIRIGTELNESKRHTGPGKGMPHFAGAYQRFYVGDECSLLGGCEKDIRKQSCKKKEFFHGLRAWSKTGRPANMVKNFCCLKQLIYLNLYVFYRYATAFIFFQSGCLMKKLFVLITSLLLSSTVSSQYCLHDGRGFYTQEDVDKFPTDNPNCKVIQGDIIISGGDIKNLDSLMGVTSIEGYLDITHTELLWSLKGLDSLQTIGGRFGIYANSGLFNLEGLGRLKSVGGVFEIFGNPYLVNLKGLDTLAFIGKNLWIGANPVLDSLKGLKNLSAIGGLLQINDNFSLTNLRELDNLKSIGGEIIINSNPSLIRLNGLDSINAGSIGGLVIYDNENLSVCSVYGICRYLEISYASVSIYHNAVGCNNRPEVKAGCDTLSVENLNSYKVCSIYPNPSAGKINVEISEDQLPGKLSVLDLNGVELRSQPIVKAVNCVDISDLKKGVYIVRLINRNTVETIKMIKE